MTAHAGERVRRSENRPKAAETLARQVVANGAAASPSCRPPRLRHHQPDHEQPECGNAGEAHEGGAAAELVADIAGQDRAERRADADGGADDALRQIEMAAAERDV